jgi:serine/threonine-protein kinase
MVQTAPLVRTVGRYAIHGEFAAGGMAAVHFGFVLGAKAFTRPVAIKRLHAHMARDPELVAMFADEARLAARVRHPNVVPTLDVVEAEGEVLVVMEYVAGESLNRLLRTASERGDPVPRPVLSAVFTGVLDGLHAAHESRDERGEPLMLVHRDVSPQNILVGIDGVPRVLDFGIAKAAGRTQTTEEGQIKGKLAYMAPEQLQQAVTRASDVYAAGVCLWEALTLRRLFEGDNPSAVIARVSAGLVAPPSHVARDVPPDLEAIVLRALDRDPSRRFETAHAMARAIEACVAPATPSAVGAWVDGLQGPTVRERAARIAQIERQGPSRPAEREVVGAATAEAPGDVAATQLTQVSSSDPRATPPSRRGLWVAALGGVALAAAGGALAAYRASHGGALPPAPVESPSATSRAADSAAAVQPPAASGQPLASAPAATSAPAPVATPSTAPAIPATRPKPRRGATPPLAAPATTKANACDPPYTVDADGVRQYKKQCLH